MFDRKNNGKLKLTFSSNEIKSVKLSLVDKTNVQIPAALDEGRFSKIEIESHPDVLEVKRFDGKKLVRTDFFIKSNIIWVEVNELD